MTTQLKDFKIIREIADGGFSEVFLVKKVSGADKNKSYALKIMRKSTVIKYDMQNQVFNELKVAKLVENAHFFTKIYYAFNTTDKLYIAFDYVSGGQLNELYGSMNFPQASVLFYMAEMIVAIEYLHSKGWFHGDIKLENILIDADGHVKLIDFGSSKKITGENPTNPQCGTDGYLAPEMIEHQYYDENVDWWALGVVVYVMLFGKFPFQSGNRITQEMINNVLKTEDLTTKMKFVLNILLKRDHTKRKVQRIKKFLHYMEWEKIAKKEVQPCNLLERVAPKVPDYGDTFKDFSYITSDLADNITHQNERDAATYVAHVCDICAKQFKHKSSIRMHMRRKHTNETPKFVCDVPDCNKKFIIESQKRTHMRKKHKVIQLRTIKTNICNICNKKFYNHVSVRRHQRSVHSHNQ